MKLVIEGAKPADQLSFSLVQDGNEVNIMCGGRIVAYFLESERNGKVTLELVGLTDEQQKAFNTDDDGYIEVER